MIKPYIQCYQKARSIMSDANFNLRAWASNCLQLSTLAKQDKAADKNTTVNILGLQWNTATDTLSFPSKTIIPDNTTLSTKREVLQQSSKDFWSIRISVSCNNPNKTVHATISLAKTY